MTPRAKPAAAPQLLSVQQIAQRLDISEDTVLRFMADGEIVYVNVGRGTGRGQAGKRLKSTEEAVAAFIARRTVGKAS